MKLKSLLVDKASAVKVKNQMEACSETKINLKVAANETAGEMKAALTDEQKEQLQTNDFFLGYKITGFYS